MADSEWVDFPEGVQSWGRIPEVGSAALRPEALSNAPPAALPSDALQSAALRREELREHPALQRVRVRDDAGSRDRWSFENLAGRTVEIRRATTAPALTAASRIVVEAQRLGQPCVWIAAEPSIFYPPDFAAAGVDLAALPVIRIPHSEDAGRAASGGGQDRSAGGRRREGRGRGSDRAPVLAARAADLLLRSGGVGLVVIDLGAHAALSIPIQTRLTALARHHHSVLVLLTRPKAGNRFGGNGPTLSGSLVSLRAEGVVRRVGFDRFAGEIHIEKDKRRSPGWRHVEVCRGPDGLC